LTPEPEKKTSPEEVARLARMTLQMLAETHVIVEKEEFADLISENLRLAEAQMWDLILDSYDKALEGLTGHLSAERLKGLDLGKRILERFRDVSMGELDRVHEENAPKI
jgi:hypothetical protein